MTESKYWRDSLKYGFVKRIEIQYVITTNDLTLEVTNSILHVCRHNVRDLQRKLMPCEGESGHRY